MFNEFTTHAEGIPQVFLAVVTAEDGMCFPQPPYEEESQERFVYGAFSCPNAADAAARGHAQDMYEERKSRYSADDLDFEQMGFFDDTMTIHFAHGERMAWVPTVESVDLLG